MWTIRRSGGALGWATWRHGGQGRAGGGFGGSRAADGGTWRVRRTRGGPQIAEERWGGPRTVWRRRGGLGVGKDGRVEWVRRRTRGRVYEHLRQQVTRAHGS